GEDANFASETLRSSSSFPINEIPPRLSIPMRTARSARSQMNHRPGQRRSTVGVAQFTSLLIVLGFRRYRQSSGTLSGGASQNIEAGWVIRRTGALTRRANAVVPRIGPRPQRIVGAHGARVGDKLRAMSLVHGGRLVAKALKRHGTSHLFTLCGGHIQAIYDGCLDEGIRVVDVRHEQTAGHAADGWARV